MIDVQLVEEALHHPSLVPHRTADPSDGPTIRLRRRMARFSADPEHGDRRRAVESVLARLDSADARAHAASLATARLVGDRIEVGPAIASIVPTGALATLLGVMDDPADPDDLAGLVADIDAVAAVVGRGEPASAASDVATDRLLVRAGAVGEQVAVASALYQNLDATSALVMVELARVAGLAVGTAVPRTRRLATVDVTLGSGDTGVTIRAGAEVAVEIGAAGLPFGAGPHACPGRELATAIVAGVCDAVAASDYAVDPASVRLDADRRPVELALSC